MYVLRRACHCTLADLARNINREIKNRAVATHRMLLCWWVFPALRHWFMHTKQGFVPCQGKPLWPGEELTKQKERKKERIKRQMYFSDRSLPKWGYTIYIYILILIYSCNIKLKLRGLNQVASWYFLFLPHPQSRLGLLLSVQQI